MGARCADAGSPAGRALKRPGLRSQDVRDTSGQELVDKSEYRIVPTSWELRTPSRDAGKRIGGSTILGRHRRASKHSAPLALAGLLAARLLIARIEREAAERALTRERRQIAADVHDLIMQDLSLALANARALTDDPLHTPTAHAVIAAGERALSGARVVIRRLAEQPSRDSEPIARTIEAGVQAAARDARLTFDAGGVPRSARADRPTREALLHIAREAVANATKHAHSNAIEVTLEYTDRWRLTVSDEGDGFDPANSADNGFGLHSMRTHVHALGGVLHVASTVEKGTTIEAVLP